jgi:hypothetical protein
MSLVKSKQRVADHGEVFTPDWMVQDMLDLVKDESERIDSRFLEPACGSGNFLVPILQRKLLTVKSRYGKSEFEKVHHSLLALMSLYGIEILEDNVEECRANLLDEFSKFLKLESTSEEYLAGEKVLGVNIVNGDALSMTTGRDLQEPITFPEWAYLGKGKFKRRDFRYDVLTTMSSFGEGTLFEDLNKHEIFFPERDYPQLSIKEIANG